MEGTKADDAQSPVFIATECFDATDGENWDNYLEFAKIPHLKEVVSLDGMLCPSIFPELVADDWKHMALDDHDWGYGYLKDVEYLKDRIGPGERRNVLGVYRNPGPRDTTPPGECFVFLGYDLIEDQTQISAFTNCGGFAETFSNDELNEYGLLPEYDRASEVQRLLLVNNPGEPHAECERYAIWRLVENPEPPQK